MVKLQNDSKNSKKTTLINLDSLSIDVGKKMIKNIDIEIDTWYINTALFGRGDAEIFEN